MTLRKVLPWCFAILLPGFPIAAQELPLPGTEAAPSIFSTQLGNPNVNLLVSGSWDAQLSGSLGWGLDLGPGALTPGIYPASFPGLQPGVVFQQVPNLTASVVLFDRYFLRASFISPALQQTNLQSTLPLDLNTFLLGYNGKPGEFLQKVRIGNTDVNISPYNFVSFPAAPRNSIGASVLFKTDRARYEAMVRYEPSNFKSKTFIGSSQLLEQRINPGSYINGRFFYLPDANVSNLQVYIEDGTGTLRGSDGHYYRPATASDAVISASGGYVFFLKPLVGRAVVYYTVNGAAVGSTSLGQGALVPTNSDGSINPNGTPANFSFTGSGMSSYPLPGYPASSGGFDMATLQVTVNGVTGLLISQPGVFSPFEADNTYTVGQTIPAIAPQVRASLVAKGGDSGSSLFVSVSPTGQTATILGIQPSGGGQAAPDPRSVAARFPLAGVDPDIYSAGPGRAAPDTNNELLVQILSPVAGYQLDPNVLPGSVTVLRNGTSEGRFTVNYDTGLLTFTTPIAANDLIVVTYQTANPQGGGGNILFGMGADFALTPSLNLDLGTGLRWSLLSQRYTTEQGTNTGALLTGVGLTYHTKELTARIRAGVSLSSPDTTGIFRLFGMEESGQTLTLTEGNLFPSSLPSSDVNEVLSAGPGGAAGPNPFTGLSLANRGDLLYKDLNSYSVGGATLEGVDFTPPSNQIYSYVNGSRIGPYPAWDSTYGVVMVMDYVMSTSSPWVGAQIPLPNAPQDLSGVTDLTFAVQGLAGSSGTITAYVQLGSISEDLDGSGIIERASSTADNLFPFHQNGMILYAGATGTSTSSFSSTTTTSTANPSTTNGLNLASDDLDGNGLLDAENGSLVLTYQIPASAISPGAGWQSIDIPIPPGDRARLTAARSVRVILVDTGGTAASGRLLVSSPTFAGSPFHAVTSPSTTATDITTATETSDPQPVGQQLTDRYPEVNTIFHPSGQINKVLRVQWGGPYPSPWTTATSFTLTGYPPPVSSGLYRTLAFYLYVHDLASGGATLQMNLVDSSGQGIHLSFQTGVTNGWHKYSVDLIAKTITVDGGASVGSPSVTVDSGAGQLTTFTLTQTGSLDGTLYLDEVHFETAIISASLGGDVNLSYAKQGTLLSLAGHPIVSNLTVHEAASAYGSNFASGFAENPGVATASTLTSIGGDLPFGNLQAAFGYSWSPVYTTVSASHALRIPIGPLTLSDTYNQSVASSGASSGALVSTTTTSGGSAASTTSAVAGSSVGSGSQAMSFSRSDSASLSLPSVLTASLSGGAVTLGGGLDQSWSSSLASRLPSPFSLSLAGQLGDNLPTFTPYSDQYFVNWSQGFGLLAPLSNPLAERTGILTSEVAYSKNPVGVDLKSQINYDSTVTNVRYQANSTSVTLSFPISLGSQPLLAWQIVPAYTRTLTTSAQAADNQNFGDDLRTYGASLAASPILYEGIPIAELFSPSALTQFTTQSEGFLGATYAPTLSLQLSRGSTSSLADLIVPTYLLVSYGRTMDREADGVTDTANWEVTERTDVLNLFGRQGVYPIFPFYNTDEFATTVDVRESTPVGTSAPLGSAQIQHLFSFYGANMSLLSFQNRLTINWGAIQSVAEDLTTAFTWRVIPLAGFHVPVVPRSFQKGMYFEHTESVEVKSEPDVLQNSLGITLSHQTALIFPQRGKLQATAGLGFQENKLSDSDTRLLFGVQAAIEGTLTF